jgi:hypothetical protein
LRLDLVLQPLRGGPKLLHWSPRLVALVAALALVLIALGGLAEELTYNLYW